MALISIPLLAFLGVTSTALFLPSQEDNNSKESIAHGLAPRASSPLLLDNCVRSSNLFAPPLAIGNPKGGKQACETHFGAGLDYAPVTGIETLLAEDGEKLAGLQLTYASGMKSPVYGSLSSTKYTPNSFETTPGETFTLCRMWDDGEGHYLGHIRLETSKGRVFDSGRGTDGIKSNEIPVGSGVLAGMQVSTTGNNDLIVYGALLFLNDDIDRVEISNVQYDKDPLGSNTGIAPQSNALGHWFNDGPGPQTYDHTQNYSEEKSYHFDQATISQFSLSNSVSFNAGIPFIGAAKSETDIHWNTSQITSQEQQQVQTSQVTCGTHGTLQPGQGVEVTAVIQTGNADFPYTSDVQVFLKGGLSYQYSEKGTLKDVDHSECNVTAKSTNKAPTGGNSPGLSPVSDLQTGAGGLDGISGSTGTGLDDTTPTSTTGSSDLTGAGATQTSALSDPSDSSNDFDDSFDPTTGGSTGSGSADSGSADSGSTGSGSTGSGSTGSGSIGAGTTGTGSNSATPTGVDDPSSGFGSSDDDFSDDGSDGSAAGGDDGSNSSIAGNDSSLDDPTGSNSSLDDPTQASSDDSDPFADDSGTGTSKFKYRRDEDDDDDEIEEPLSDMIAHYI